MLIFLIISSAFAAQTANKAHFITDQCTAIYKNEPAKTKQAKINDCTQTNMECEKKSNTAAKVLCACNEDVLPGKRDRDACYRGALQVIQGPDKNIKTAELIAQKLPKCKRLGKREASDPGDLDDIEEHIKCLKNAFFETDLAIQGLENSRRLQEQSKDQTVEGDMRIQEMQRNDNFFQ